MVRTTIGANVDPDIKARLIKAVASDGKTVNEIIKDLVNDYLENHDKIEHPSKYEPSKTEKLEIVPPEEEEKITIVDDEGMLTKEFLKEVLYTIRDYYRELGYTLVKTDTLKKILAVLKKKKEEMEKDDFVCPGCNYRSESKFKYCPECGEAVTWED